MLTFHAPDEEFEFGFLRLPSPKMAAFFVFDYGYLRYG
jgi:hypothetical protein